MATNTRSRASSRGSGSSEGSAFGWSNQAGTLALAAVAGAAVGLAANFGRKLLAKLKAALGKHALQEENVIYPALREFNNAHDADALNGEHGYVKTFLYELENSDPASSDWLAKVRTFRTMLAEHMRMEEDEVFPALKAGLDEAGNAKLGATMVKEGMKLA